MTSSVRDLVGWTVQDPPPELVLGRAVEGVLRVADAVSTLGASSTGGRHRPDFTLPDDPDAFADLGRLTLAGRSGWLPDAGTHPLAATRRDLWRLPRAGADRPTERVPLELLHVTSAAPTGRSRRPRHPHAPWTLGLTDGTAALRMDGAWLALAWVGHLAGWPEPTPAR